MTSDPAFTIPPLYCPDPVRDDDVLGYQVDDLLLSWIQQSGIFSGKLEVIAASHFGRYAMLAHPDTDDPDRLLLSAQCFAALFAVDDCYCDDERAGSSPALLGRRLSLALAAIEPTHLVGDYSLQLDNALAADPVLVGLRDYFNRVAHFATPTQLARVRHETIAMFVTMGAEAGSRLRIRTTRRCLLRPSGPPRHHPRRQRDRLRQRPVLRVQRGPNRNGRFRPPQADRT